MRRFLVLALLLLGGVPSGAWGQRLPAGAVPLHYAITLAPDLAREVGEVVLLGGGLLAGQVPQGLAHLKTGLQMLAGRGRWARFQRAGQRAVAELREPRMEPGLHHLGVAVDNIDAIVARYHARYPRGTVIAESGDLQHGQVRIYDPECNPVTLSQNSFGLGRALPRIPRIAHFALNALDTEVEVASYTGRRWIPFTALFLGPGKSARMATRRPAALAAARIRLMRSPCSE